MAGFDLNHNLLADLVRFLVIKQDPVTTGQHVERYGFLGFSVALQQHSLSLCLDHGVECCNRRTPLRRCEFQCPALWKINHSLAGLARFHHHIPRPQLRFVEHRPVLEENVITPGHHLMGQRLAGLGVAGKKVAAFAGPVHSEKSHKRPARLGGCQIQGSALGKINHSLAGLARLHHHIPRPQLRLVEHRPVLEENVVAPGQHVMDQRLAGLGIAGMKVAAFAGFVHPEKSHKGPAGLGGRNGKHAFLHEFGGLMVCLPYFYVDCFQLKERLFRNGQVPHHDVIGPRRYFYRIGLLVVSVSRRHGAAVVGCVDLDQGTEELAALGGGHLEHTEILRFLDRLLCRHLELLSALGRIVATAPGLGHAVELLALLLGNVKADHVKGEPDTGFFKGLDQGAWVARAGLLAVADQDDAGFSFQGFHLFGGLLDRKGDRCHALRRNGLDGVQQVLFIQRL